MDYTSFQPESSPNQNPGPQIMDQTPMPEMPPTTKHLSPKMLGLITVILLLAGAAYGAIWRWQKQQSAQQVAPTFTPRADVMAGWQTYTNAQYGFEFKYPQQFNLKEIWPGENGVPIVNSDTFGEIDLYAKDASNQEFKFIVSGYPTATIINWWFKSANLQNDLIASRPVKVFDSSLKGKQYFDEKLTYQVLLGDVNDGNINVGLVAGSTMGKNSDFSQILSTFKFIDSADTSTWKTYRNDQYGFEFKYPSSWKFDGPHISYAGSTPYGMGIVMTSSTHPDYPDSDYGIVNFAVNDEVTYGLSYCPTNTINKTCFSEFRNINGLQWIVKTYAWEDGEGAGLKEKTASVIQNGKLYTFYTGCCGVSQTDSLSTIAHNNTYLDQILSTFKFTNIQQSGSYDIKDPGLQFVLPSTLFDLTHQVVKLAGDQAVNSVGFSSKRLEAAGCSASSAPLGYLTYDNNKGGVVIGHIRGSDLYYIKPNGQCKASPSLQAWQILKDALSGSLSTDAREGNL